jgi:subtilase family serine protease
VRTFPRLARLSAVAGALVTVAFVVSSAAAAAPGGRHPLPGSKPSWTAAAPQTAPVRAGDQVSAKVWLAPRDPAALKTLATAISDPASSRYRQFITPQQYDATFAPTAAQLKQVTDWLTGAGLHVDTVGPDSHFVAVSGTASDIEAAFDTGLARYAVNGKQAQAPTSAVTVPDSLAGIVLGVTGLSTLNHAVQPGDFGAPDAYVNSTTCSSYYDEKLAAAQPPFQGKTLPYAPCGYTPSQLRGAYGIDHTGLSGNKQTIAIVDAFDASTLEQDANTYAHNQHEKPFSPKQFADRSVGEDVSKEADCGGNGWYGEQTLDIEASHAMAPNANVLYYGGASCYDDDLLASLTRVVHDNDASIVSNSWGEPTFVVIDGQLYITLDQSTIDAYESVFQQGAAQGIGFYFSSGDDGDEQDAYGYTHPDYPTGDPWVTSVGGTSLAVGKNDQRLFETGWGTDKYALSDDASSWTPVDSFGNGDSFLYGAGGGYSKLFDRPAYQQGVVPSSTSGRAVPDVAMDADPTTGMLVGETQSFSGPSRFGPAGVHYGEYRIGGTSLATPLFAGFVADVAQAAGGRVGFANPWIYGLAKAAPSVYYDVTPQGDVGNVRADYTNGLNADGGYTYSVRTFDTDSSLVTAPGWDDVTGVGTPNLGIFKHGRR